MMNQEEKKLLLIDLCARLPYDNTYVQYTGDVPTGLGAVKLNHEIIKIIETLPEELNITVKPYLRPMSSMTEEDLRDFAQLKFKNNEIWEIDDFPKMKFGFKGFINVHCKNKYSRDIWTFQITTNSLLENYLGIDWLNAHHFDFRNLIERGLAIDLTNKCYTSNEKI